MKKMLMLGLLSILVSCTPSINPLEKAEKMNTGVTFLFNNPKVMHVWIEGIGQYPESKNAALEVDCANGTIISSGSIENLSKQNPGLIQGSFIVYKDYVLGCRDGHVYAKSSSYERTLRAAAGGMIGRNLDGDMELLLADGYMYPNLKVGYTSFHATVVTKNGMIRAYDGTNSMKDAYQTSIIGINHDGKAGELKNGDRLGVMAINPNQPITLTYKMDGSSSLWRSISFNISTGEIWANDDAPSR